MTQNAQEASKCHQIVAERLSTDTDKSITNHNQLGKADDLSWAKMKRYEIQLVKLSQLYAESEHKW